MSVLPDCAICGGPVVLDPEGDRGPVEACTECGNAQRVLPVFGGIRQAVAEVVAQVHREGLPIMRCPSCKRDRHDNCHASGCECTTGAHPRRPVAQA